MLGPVGDPLVSLRERDDERSRTGRVTSVCYAERSLGIRAAQIFSIGAILMSSFFAPALSKRTWAMRLAPSPVTASTRPSPKSS